MKDWTDKEEVEHGKWKGKLWSDLHRNSVEWYATELDGGPLKSCAEAELARRKEIGEW